jgi:hypothetical protein
MNERTPTHIAFAVRRENPTDPLRRERRVEGHLMEIGHGLISTRCDKCGSDTASEQHRVILDRLPIGGFNGHIYLHPVGLRPWGAEAQPETTDQDDPS